MIEVKKKLFFVLIVAVWLFPIVIGEGFLLNYENAPGPLAHPSPQWPAGTSLQKSSGRPTLLMFVHPRCPCSKASLGELALLAARCRDKVSIQVIFLKPEKFSIQWTETGLWQKAREIPGVKTVIDEKGKESGFFGALTSGQTLLYGMDGRLLFQGGITASRGHSGDNDGREAIESILLKGTAERRQTPVFGCSLLDQKQSWMERLLPLWKK